MARVLITGMSGAGKTAVIQELAARGQFAHDLDTPEWSHWIDVDPADALTPAKGRDWVWREDRVRALLSAHAEGTLFVGGCAENMGRLFDQIEMVILLSAPAETIIKRLAARSSGGYGSTTEERAKVSELVSTVEPLLRQSADHELDTRRSVRATVDELLRLV
jgi:shikimate kinase